MVPIISWVESCSRLKVPLQNGIILGLVLIFSYQASSVCVMDRFSPLEYVVQMAENPGSRAPYFHPFRAGVVFDSHAGPTDTVVFDGGVTDSWSYPVYGKELQRSVRILLDGQNVQVVAKGADWVVIDRMWSITWEHPGLVDMGQFFRFIGKGEPRPEDVKTFNILIHDPEWQLVYFVKPKNQAIFRRVIR
jgi:hypothetical protein